MCEVILDAMAQGEILGGRDPNAVAALAVQPAVFHAYGRLTARPSHYATDIVAGIPSVARLIEPAPAKIDTLDAR